MNRRQLLVGGAAALGSLLLLPLFPAEAHAATDVVITEIEVPPGPEAKATAKMVRRLLTSAAKRADWTGKSSAGKSGGPTRVRIRARVTELDLVEADGVLRVRCTMVGRVEGGNGARSRLDFGGKPSQRTALKKKVVGMVSDGLVTRLAQIAREQKKP
jgi:hypothetical protein